MLERLKPYIKLAANCVKIANPQKHGDGLGG